MPSSCQSEGRRRVLSSMLWRRPPTRRRNMAKGGEQREGRERRTSGTKDGDLGKVGGRGREGSSGREGRGSLESEHLLRREGGDGRRKNSSGSLREKNSRVDPARGGRRTCKATILL